MSSLALIGVSLLLMLVALPVTAVGGALESTAVYVAGLVVFGIGAVIPPALRYVGPGSDDEDGA